MTTILQCTRCAVEVEKMNEHTQCAAPFQMMFICDACGEKFDTQPAAERCCLPKAYEDLMGRER